MHPPTWRLVLGFVLAPVVPCLLVAASVSLIADQWNSFWFGATAMSVVSEGLCLVVALPLYLVLRRIRKIGLRECILSGIAITVVFNAASLLIPMSGYSAGDAGGDTIIDGVVTAHGYVSMAFSTAAQSVQGAAIAFCFWVIAIRTK